MTLTGTRSPTTITTTMDSPIGELLVAVDETTERRYLFRVVDVTYGSEHREPGWAERVAGTLLAERQAAAQRSCDCSTCIAQRSAGLPPGSCRLRL